MPGPHALEHSSYRKHTLNKFIKEHKGTSVSWDVVLRAGLA